MSNDPIIGERRFVDRAIRPIYLNERGQYVIDDDGAKVPGFFIYPDETPKIPGSFITIL